MKFSLVSREVIADSIETAVSAESRDGVIAIGGCDKNMPGAMIAFARMNVPAIFVYGGTIKPGHLDGRDLTICERLRGGGGNSAPAGLLPSNCTRSNATPAPERGPAAACIPRTPCPRRLRPWA